MLNVGNACCPRVNTATSELGGGLVTEEGNLAAGDNQGRYVPVNVNAESRRGRCSWNVVSVDAATFSPSSFASRMAGLSDTGDEGMPCLCRKSSHCSSRYAAAKPQKTVFFSTRRISPVKSYRRPIVLFRPSRRFCAIWTIRLRCTRLTARASLSRDSDVDGPYLARSFSDSSNSVGNFEARAMGPVMTREATNPVCSVHTMDESAGKPGRRIGSPSTLHNPGGTGWNFGLLTAGPADVIMYH